MGRLAKLLSFARITRNGAKASDVKIDPGGGPNITAEHFASPGDDSYPLPGDYVATADIRRNGGEVVVGYLDPSNDQKSQPGDKRIYARDSNGAMIVEIWLKNDGSAVIDNGFGSIELQSSGDVVINGVTIDASGNMTVPTSLTLAGKELAGHDHNITSGSSAPGPTGPNN